MVLELPVCKRCCCCAPLRYGLIVFAYIKLVIACFIVVGAYFETMYIVKKNEHLIRNITIAIFVIDVIFSLIFIIGCHKKSVRLLRIYYFYGLYFSAMIIAHSVYRIVNFILVVVRKNYYQYLHIMDLSVFSLIFIIIVWHIYTIFLVRSECIKLKNGYQFKFENNAVEAQCTLDLEQENDTKIIEDKQINTCS